MKKRMVLGLLSIGLLLGGCGNKEASSTKEKEKSDSKQEIVLASERDVSRGNEDAYWTNLNLEVWEPLIGLDNSGKIIPVLAKEWEMSDDAKTWTFKLREDVSFSDDTKFDSSVVEKNFERYRKISPGSSSFFTLDIDKTYPGLKELKTIDDYTFSLTFDNPMPTLPYTMLNWGSPMVSPKCFDEKTGEFTKPVVGTGAFIIDKHQPEEFTEFVRNDNYWGEKAKTEKFKVRMIPEHDTRVAALKSDEIQGVYDNKAIQPLAAKELEETGKFDISSTLSANIHYLQVNNAKEPLKNKEMKQAISYAIDRETLLNDIYGGYGKVSGNLLSPLNSFYIKTPVEYNVEKAKKLSDNVLKGEKLKVSLLTTAQYQTDCELISSWLSEIGLDVKIEVLEYEAQKERRQKGDYDLVMGFRGMDNADPATMLSSFLSKDGYDNTTYNMGYESKEATELLNKLDNTFDMDKRKEMYDNIQKFGAEELPIIPLLGVDTTVASSNKIQGYQANWTGVSVKTMAWSNK